MFDSSLVHISDANFKNLYQGRVTPILRFQESQLSFTRGSFSHFNKVLFFLEGGTYVFDGLHVSYGQMIYQSEPYMVNSIVFDVSAAELTISNAIFLGIFSKYSSPIIYIENDPQASEKHSLRITGSRFANNVANDSAGVLMAVNTNVTVDSCTFENNTALSKDGGALYLDCQDTISSSCSYNISNSIFKNNMAGVNGGAIKYTFYAPNISKNNTFVGNQAKYGSTVASYPVQMRIFEK
jgi:predicted outer membrane repeat protein